MNNHKSTLPFSCSPTYSLCPLLLLLMHSLKNRVFFLRRFRGQERHRELVQPHTKEKWLTIVCKTVIINKYFK